MSSTSHRRLKLKDSIEKYEKKQTVLSKFFKSKTATQNVHKKDSTKRNREHQDEDCDSSSKKVCKSPHKEENATESQTVTLAKTTSLKIQSFSTPRTNWDHINTNTERDLIRLASTSFQTDQNKSCLQQHLISSQSSSKLDNDKIKRYREENPTDESPSKLEAFKRSGASSSKSRNSVSKADSATSVKKVKYTPLEQQVVVLKEQHPEVLLFVECGYKFRFFGEDAEIAAKELNIFCHMDHNFMTASIPVHRLHVHLSRLVAKGYKVGVVKQTETAALKAAGENKSAPFTRKLTAVYTRATFIGQDTEPTGSEADENVSASGHLMCISESTSAGKTSKNTTTLAIVSVQLSTGEIVHDVFEDGAARAQLMTRLTHMDPVEVLLPQGVSEPTARAVKHHVVLKSRACADDVTRTEMLQDDWFDQTKAAINVRQCYCDMDAASDCISTVLQLPAPVLAALHALVKYLTDFNLQRLLKVNSLFQKFSEESQHMFLGGRTLEDLEVFANSTNGREEGSLFWLLNKTSTKFGAWLLKKWLSKPSRNKAQIEERLDAIEDIVEEKCPSLNQIKEIFQKLPDLEKTLAVIFHQKCSPLEFLGFCQALDKIQREIAKHNDKLKSDLQSVLLKDICENLKDSLSGVVEWIDALDAEHAKKSGDKSCLFKQDGNFPKLRQFKQNMEDLLKEIQSHKREVRKILKAPALEYCTIQGTEFLIEVRNTNLKLVPSDWLKISSTKVMSRFHSPFIVGTVKKLSQLREQINIESDFAWQSFLRSFEDEYPHYKKAVGQLAVVDCLFALALVTKQNGYCRPEIVNDTSCLHIEQGRHPIVDAWKAEQNQFVPNDTALQASKERCMIITGPNMGGKSSYIKQVALITLLAQVGCHVPAASAKVGLVDAILTRMGASDELFQGRSTFMVELQEASEAIAKATSRSLVILDELGRGTSTHDGVAIAYATLKYFVQEVKCLTLFVTHYPPITEIETLFPGIVQNYHMSFYVQDEDEGDSENDIECLAFLYQLVPGVAQCSYGLNVARLAGIPKSILSIAKTRSCGMREQVQDRLAKQDVFAKLMKSEPDVGNLKKILDSL